ncbi:protein TIPIN homolog [Scaptodrosophila lebanonensis]|uniref:TIMELESS-interacting protein n=1 Tax=Drosophila lebanonensis TaxID=7225 RepID=A0A6J2UA86_DROLE|nr:protein TIPIN homolog [Scaptodrosophila lebanonensis]
MASIFGDDGVDDLFNDNIGPSQVEDDLPGDNENWDADVGAGENEKPDEDPQIAEGDEKGLKVEAKKRTVRNPRPRLTVDKLLGPRGLHTIEEYFKDINFKGKGYEKSDLDEVLRRLQHWGHRMYPNYTFDDVLNNIERLGKKKQLQVHMTRYRLGQISASTITEELVDDPNDEDNNVGAVEEPFDEFDALLGEQIAMSKLAPHTPSNHHRSFGGNTTSTSTMLATPSFSRNAVVSTPYSTIGSPAVARNACGADDFSHYARPLAPSQPQTPASKQLSADQMARIAENRRLAQERLLAKQAAADAS